MGAKCGFQDPQRETVSRCANDASHDGNHSWKLEIDMESILPLCRVCREKAGRCPCPAEDGFGATNAVIVVEYPPTDARSLELLARIKARTDAAPAAGTSAAAKPVRRPTVPAYITRPQPLYTGFWCPAHGHNKATGCEGCGTVTTPAMVAHEPTDWLLKDDDLPVLCGFRGWVMWPLREPKNYRR